MRFHSNHARYNSPFPPGQEEPINLEWQVPNILLFYLAPVIDAVLKSATTTMEPAIITSVCAILYGCPKDSTEEDLMAEMQRRYSVAAGLAQEGALPEAIVDAIEGFDGSTPCEEKENGRARRDEAARSLCQLRRYGYLEVKILAEKYAGELGIQWASQFTNASSSGLSACPPLKRS
jgi:hypothetical protein